MKKQLLMSLMMLIGIAAALPGSNDQVKEVKAVNEVEKGFISNNLVNEDGVVVLNDDVNKKIDSNFSEIDLSNLRATKFDDSFLKGIEGNKEKSILVNKTSPVLGISYVPSGENANLNTLNEISHYDFIYKEDFRKSDVHLFHAKYSFDYVLEDWNTTKEQPLEMIFSFDFEMLNEIPSLFPSFLGHTIPLIMIDGVSYLDITFSEKNGVSLISNNSRVFTSYVYDENKQSYEYGNYAFIELPFRTQINTIEIFHPIELVHPIKKPFKFKSAIFILNDAYDNAKKTPLTFSDINLKNGTISVFSGNSVFNGAINYDDSYYQLNSIVIDNSLTLYTKWISHNEFTRTDLYELYLDSDYSQKFTYESNHEFINDLKNNNEKKFYITKYNYTKQSYSATDELTSTTEFVDMGTFYAFKNITKEQIRTVSFNGLRHKNSFYSRLVFSAYDNIANVNISKINALWFHYMYAGKERSLSICGKEINDYVYGGSALDDFYGDINPPFVTAGANAAIFGTIDGANKFEKKDDYGNKFILGGIQKTDYHFFDWDSEPELKATPQNELFLLYTKGDVVFDSLISCVYVDKKGDIINASETLPDGTVAPTAIIADDGTVKVMDIKGRIIGGTVDDKGFFLDENGDRRPDPDNVHDGKNKDWVEKTIKIALTIAGFVAIVWTISKIGPTIATLINGRRKKNE